MCEAKKLADANLGLMYKMCIGYAKLHGVPARELYADGYAGLRRAAEKYVAGLTTQAFSTVACNYVLGYVKNGFREQRRECPSFTDTSPLRLARATARQHHGFREVDNRDELDDHVRQVAMSPKARDMVALMRQGMSGEQIASRYGCTRKAVSLVRRRLVTGGLK